MCGLHRLVQGARFLAIVAVLASGFALTGTAAVLWRSNTEFPIARMRMGFASLAGERVAAVLNQDALDFMHPGPQNVD